MHNLITRAGKTKYIKHYQDLERKYLTADNAYKIINDKFYYDILNSVKNCKQEQTKLSTYKSIYGENLSKTSLTLGTNNVMHQKLFSKYILSSHNLACETSKWKGNNKSCKQCDSGDWETLEHFLFDCAASRNITNLYNDFPVDLMSFFEWRHSGEVLEILHKQRKE